MSMDLVSRVKSSFSGWFGLFDVDEGNKNIGVYGPPNAGKCLHPDEDIIINDESVNIEEFFNSMYSKNENVDEAGFETYIDVREDNVTVPSINESGEVITAEVSTLYRQTYIGELYTITTETGESVTVSPSHPFLTDTEDITFTEAGELQNDSVVGVLSSESQNSGNTSVLKRVLTDSAIEEISTDTYIGYIYDITVPDTENFVSPEGLVLHNTTLTNQILDDWGVEEDVDGQSTSEVPHETRRANKESVEIETEGGTVSFEIVDTPGVASSVDYEEFLDYGMEEDDAIERSRGATEGIAEAMHWLREDVDGVIYMLDSTQDPFTQVNTMTLGIIESQGMPAVILANKTDLDEANVKRIRDAFPQHTVVPVSALEGDNMETVYEKIGDVFGDAQ